jgi:non-homologous end joining protein Ku
MYEDEIIRYDATNDQFIVIGDEEIYKVYDDATYGYFLSEHED